MNWHPTEGRCAVRSEDGTLQWTEWVENTLVDQGEASVLNVYFREQSNPSKYLGLLNQAGNPVETDTVALLTEARAPGSGGYARQQVLSTDWSAPALDTGDMQSVATVTFGPVATTAMTCTHVFMTTAATGTAGQFILYVPLAATTTLAIGQSLVYQLRSKAQ